MDVGEVREWLSAGQEIGTHTLSHPRLAAIPEAQAKEEIFALKKKLEDLFGVTVRHFRYPYDKWSRRVRDLVEGAGYATAVTLDFGFNAEIRDPFPLRRKPWPKSDYGCFAAHSTRQTRPGRRSVSARREMIIV